MSQFTDTLVEDIKELTNGNHAEIEKSLQKYSAAQLKAFTGNVETLLYLAIQIGRVR